MFNKSQTLYSFVFFVVFLHPTLVVSEEVWHLDDSERVESGLTAALSDGRSNYSGAIQNFTLKFWLLEHC